MMEQNQNSPPNPQVVDTQVSWEIGEELISAVISAAVWTTERKPGTWQKMIEAAKVSIEQSRKEAELQFRNEVSKFSIEIAEKMVRTQMKDNAAQVKLVDKLLDEIEKN